MKKILVIRFSSIGDIVLTSPVVRCLKQQIPNCEIHYAVKKSFSSILISNPYVDKVHVLDKNERDFISQLKKEKFDLIIDLHNNIRTAKIKFLLRVKSYQFNKLNFKKFLLTQFKINLLPDKHVVDRYFEAVRFLGAKNDGKACDFFIPMDTSLNIEVEDFIHSKMPIAIAIGSKHNTKQIPNEKLIKLIENSNHNFLLLGGKDDFLKAEVIKNYFSEKVMNTCGKLTLEESALALKKCGTIITPDTGLMHIAAALNLNVISVWGNTVPDFGMYPYMPQLPGNYKVMEINNLKCRPCSKIGYEECPKKHFKCMMNQDFSDILDGFVENK
ncbi:MAG: glycosyltransferase family 9 protein [Bacteroidales bacterium]|nr:glycosyltransferase family 9 protein [Bacteroidales bacterium]